jgi:hypothetical protein
VSPVRYSVIHALLVDFGPPGHHTSHPTSPWICRPPSCSCRSSPAPRTSRPPPSSRNRAPPPPTCHRHTVPLPGVYQQRRASFSPYSKGCIEFICNYYPRFLMLGSC